MKTKDCRCCNGTGREPDQADIGSRMRKLRQESGFSLRRMAVSLGYTAPYLSDLENGKRNWRKSLMDYYEAVHAKAAKTEKRI